MLANLKNFKQAVLLNLDEDNQVQNLGYIGQDGEYHGNEMLQKLEYAYHGNQNIDRLFGHKLMNLDQESNSLDNESDKKVFKVRRGRSNSSRKVAKLVTLKSVRSISVKSAPSKDSVSVQNLADIFSESENSFIDLSDNSSHKQQIAKKVQSQDSISLNDSLENLSDDGFMNAYCRSLGYGTDNCRKWAGYSAKSKSTNIASAKSDSDNDNKSVSSFTGSDDSKDGDTDSNSALSEYLMQLNILSKMGKGLKKAEKKIKQVRDYGKKVYPAAEEVWAVAAPKNHDKYAPKLAKGYKTFNEEANKLGGWGTVHKVEDKLVGMEGKSKQEILCELLEEEAFVNAPLFNGKSAEAIAYRTNLQTKIQNLGCY